VAWKMEPEEHSDSGWQPYTQVGAAAMPGAGPPGMHRGLPTGLKIKQRTHLLVSMFPMACASLLGAHVPARSQDQGAAELQHRGWRLGRYGATDGCPLTFIRKLLALEPVPINVQVCGCHLGMRGARAGCCRSAERGPCPVRCR